MTRQLSEYSTGTLSVANGSLTVTVAGGGLFRQTVSGVTQYNVVGGDALIVGNQRPIFIREITSDTTLTLEEPWPHTTVSAGAYRIRRYAPNLDNLISGSLDAIEGKGGSTRPLIGQYLDNGAGRARQTFDGSGNPIVQVGAASAADGALLTALSINKATGAIGAPLGLADPAFQLLGSPKNLLINGSMDIWQRGTSFASDGYTADRWRAINITAVSQQAGPTQSQTGNLGSFTNAIRFGNSGATFPQIQQRIERARIRHLAGKKVTLSFWARQISGTAALWAEIITPSAADNYTSNSATFIGQAWLASAGPSTWTRYTMSFDVPAGAENVGMGINITAGNTSATTVEVAGVQLEAGPIATCFDFRPIAAELVLCKRYFQLVGNANSVVFSSATDADVLIDLPIEMRATPTSALVSGTHQFIVPGVAAPLITPTLGGSQRTPTGVMQSIGGFTGRTLQQHGYCYTDFIQLSAEI